MLLLFAAKVQRRGFCSAVWTSSMAKFPLTCTRKEREEAKKEQRRITQLEKDKEAMEKGIASSKQMILTLAEKGVAHLRSYTVAHLKDLIWYKFKSDVYKQQGIKKAGLVDAATVLYQQKANGNEEVKPKIQFPIFT